jgi:glycosyltransferase involved in cell wall biosynthesis
MTNDERKTRYAIRDTQHAIRNTLAVVVLTKNEERHIGACLDSLAWAERRVVFDSFSTDRTCDIGRERGAEVIQHPFENFAAQRNEAMAAIDADYFFFVDADERVPPELAGEIQSILKMDTPPVSASFPKKGEGQGVGEIVGWWVSRRNYLFGRMTRGAGYWPDYQMRLLRRGRARYDRPASEIAVLEGAEGYLQHPLLHYNYDTLAQFHAKQRVREPFEVQNLFEKGVRPKRRTLITQPLRHFWWRFVTLKGYRDGLHGLRLSILLAYYFGYRYTRGLAALWRQKT